MLTTCINPIVGVCTPIDEFGTMMKFCSFIRTCLRPALTRSYILVTGVVLERLLTPLMFPAFGVRRGYF